MTSACKLSHTLLPWLLSDYRHVSSQIPFLLLSVQFSQCFNSFISFSSASPSQQNYCRRTGVVSFGFEPVLPHPLLEFFLQYKHDKCTPTGHPLGMFLKILKFWYSIFFVLLMVAGYCGIF